MAQGKHYATPIEVRRDRERRVFISGFAYGALACAAVVAAFVALVLWTL